MNKEYRKKIGITAVSIFVVTLLLSTASAVPIKNTEAVKNKINDKLEQDLALKERIKERYPEVYDAVTSGIIMNFPIFCWTMFFVLIIVVSILYDWFLMTEFPIVEYLFCTICIKSYEPTGEMK